MPIRMVSDWATIDTTLTALLLSESPAFLGRLGGSDTDALAALHMGGRDAALAHLPIVRRYNGYYDKTNDPEKYFAYLKRLEDSFRVCPHTVFGGAKLLSMFFGQSIHPTYRVTEIPDARGLLHLAGLPGDANA